MEHPGVHIPWSGGDRRLRGAPGAHHCHWEKDGASQGCASQGQGGTEQRGVCIPWLEKGQSTLGVHISWLE